MRVALVHDWLTGTRGGEKVLEEFCILFPEADLFTLVHVPGTVSERIEDRRIVTSPLSRLPGIARHYRKFLPLFPELVERFDLRGYDFILSSSSCVAKGIRTPPGARHVSYVFSPMRYLWDRYDDYFGAGQAGLATRAAMRLLRGRLRKWDRESTDRVTVLVAISTFVQERIRRIYGRESEIVYPPVDDELFRPADVEPSASWLVVSAFAPYKRVDLAIRAAEIAGVGLTVVGKGPEEAALRKIAGPRVRFLGWASDAELVRLYSSCRGLLFPGVEDFGITPLESMACGRPVIAYREGGALETVRGASWPGDPAGVTAGATGLFVREQNPERFAEAIRHLEKNPNLVESADCRGRAEEFGREIFRARMREGIERWMGSDSAREAPATP